MQTDEMSKREGNGQTVGADTKSASNAPLATGLLLSLLYVLVGLAYVHDRWDKLAALPPNEFGDFLAGAFGPLAILWLVVGYFQQGKELRQNTEALRMQAAELKASVEQQQRMAKAAEAQVASLREADISRNTPRFMYDFGNFSPFNAQPHYAVKLKNHGAPCQNVIANVRMPWGVTKFELHELPYLGDWEVPLPWHGQTPSEGPVRVEFVVVTLGRGRLRCSLDLRFNRDTAGELQLVFDTMSPFKEV